MKNFHPKHREARKKERGEAGIGQPLETIRMEGEQTP